MSQPTPKKENIFILALALTLTAAIAAGVLACVDFITQKPRQLAAIKETNAALRVLAPGLNNDPDADKIYVVDKNKAKEPADGDWSILPKGESDAAYGVHSVTMFPAKKDGKLIAVICKAVSPIGYGGNMTVMASLDPKNGAVQHVIVTQNNETPGLGTVVVGRTRQLTLWGLFKGDDHTNEESLPPNKILDYFDGKIYVANDKYVGKLKQNPNVIPASKWLVKKDGGDFLYMTGATISSRAVTYGVRKIETVYYAVCPEVLKAFGYTPDKKKK